jgi:hypothetical protein
MSVSISDMHLVLQGSGASSCLLVVLIPGAMDLATRGSLNWTTEIHSGSLGFGESKLKPGLLSAFTRSHGSNDVCLLEWMTEIHSRSPGSGRIKTQTYFSFSVFTQSYGSDETWLLLINGSDSLRAFRTLGRQCR